MHCHLRRANLIGMPAAFLAGVRRRIYTRHFSTYNHMYHPNAVGRDRLVNRLSTQIVAISMNVFRVLTELEGVPVRKVSVIPHGFELEGFANVDPERVSALRNRWDLQDDRPVVGVISRFMELKGIQYIIPAVERLRSSGIDPVLVLANATGPYEPEILRLLSSWKEEDYRIIPFEKDVQALYQLFDALVHVPIDRSIEAFGQIYVETMAASVPSVVTLSGIAHELVRDDENAIVVPYRDSGAIEEGLRRVLSDGSLRARLAASGRESLEPYSLTNFADALLAVYRGEGVQAP